MSTVWVCLLLLVYRSMSVFTLAAVVDLSAACWQAGDWRHRSLGPWWRHRWRHGAGVAAGWRHTGARVRRAYTAVHTSHYHHQQQQQQQQRGGCEWPAASSHLRRTWWARQAGWRSRDTAADAALCQRTSTQWTVSPRPRPRQVYSPPARWRHFRCVHQQPISDKDEPLPAVNHLWSSGRRPRPPPAIHSVPACTACLEWTRLDYCNPLPHTHTHTHTTLSDCAYQCLIAFCFTCQDYRS